MDTSNAVPLPTHPVLRQLWQVIERKQSAGLATPVELLELFWAEVAEKRTPLLRDGCPDASSR